MTKIKQIFACEILDSRGNPTVETTIELENNLKIKSAIPSGASKGSSEALELRDEDKNRFEGKGVLKAVENVNKVIAPHIINSDVFNLVEIDKIMIELDGTKNKSNLGANAILSISQAIAKAGALASNQSLYTYLRKFINTKIESNKIPTPVFNIIEGGAHANNNLDFQEFLLIPATSKSLKEGLELGVKVYYSLKKILIEIGTPLSISDEGAFSPNLSTNQEALNLLKQAIEKASYKLSSDAFTGIDAAANEFKEQDNYKISDRATLYTKEEFVQFYKNIISLYSMIYIEDPFSENDWEAWSMLSSITPLNTLIVGDDLTTTNPERLKLAIEKKAINGIVIKPNQIGTVTETLRACQLAKENNIKITVAHRSGETSDDFVSDLAVAVAADYVKFGPPVKERVFKYNRLIEIESDLINNDQKVISH